MQQFVKNLTENWTLTLVPESRVRKDGFSPKRVAEVRSSGYVTVPAKVPGNFELDLFAAGLEPDPYFSQNPFRYQKYEDRHLFYCQEFESPIEEDEDTFFLFEGIDTVADIFLNGSRIGRTENMLIEHELPAKGLKKGKNELLVHIFPSVIEARKTELKPLSFAMRYNYDSLALRKAPSMYGWDIMPRFVSGGIWKPVKLLRKPRERIEQLAFYTTWIAPGKDRAGVNLFFGITSPEDSIRELTLSVHGVCGDSEFDSCQKLWHTYGLLRIEVNAPRLWYPKNAGAPDLYEIEVTLTRNGQLCDKKDLKFGIRTVELDRTSVTDETGKGEFCFRINGKKVFWLGSNWVPLDAFPSRNKELLPSALALLDEIGCNGVRCWGGNAYENDEFYDFCDEHGILVWQDFAMGCAVNPQTDEFAEKLRIEAEAVIKRLRNHASLVLWAGDNECDSAFLGWNGYRMDPNRNRLTREILPEAVRNNDFSRPYLPSSPYIDEEAFRTGRPTSEEHLWGPRDYFKGDFYSSSVCHFASETGYHGCPSPSSLKKMLAPDKVWPIDTPEGHANYDWICHAAQPEPTMDGPYAYRIRLMMDQVRTLFGELPETLDRFAKASQISQAEAFKYFIERFRMTKWRRTGIIWWNVIDGWPQISDAVVDWYRCKKLAYHYIRRSQDPLCLMLGEPENGKQTVYAVSDGCPDQTFRYTVTDLTGDRILLSGTGAFLTDQSHPVGSVEALEDYHFLLLEWETENGRKGSNHFVTRTRDISLSRYLLDLQKAGYDEFEGFEE